MYKYIQAPDANDDIDKNALRVVQFYDLSRITLINEVIGLMCDGQYKEMQNFLREQTQSIQSINMVQEITSFLYEFSKKRLITSETLPLLNKVVQSLIELCSGNYKNSEVIFQQQIVSIINYFLQIDITEIKSKIEPDNKLEKEYTELRKKGLELKASAVELLEVMLENVSPKTKDLSRQITGGLDIHALHWSMVDFFILKDDEELIKAEYDDNATRALFKTYSIIKHLIYNEVTSLTSLGMYKR